MKMLHPYTRWYKSQRIWGIQKKHFLQVLFKNVNGRLLLIFFQDEKF